MKFDLINSAFFNILNHTCKDVMFGLVGLTRYDAAPKKINRFSCNHYGCFFIILGVYHYDFDENDPVN